MRETSQRKKCQPSRKHTEETVKYPFILDVVKSVADYCQQSFSRLFYGKLLALALLLSRQEIMSIAAEMGLSPGGGATREHISGGSATEEQRRPGPKTLSPQGLGGKRAAALLLLPYRSISGYARSSRPAGTSFCSNGDIHNF